MKNKSTLKKVNVACPVVDYALKNDRTKIDYGMDSKCMNKKCNKILKSARGFCSKSCYDDFYEKFK